MAWCGIHPAAQEDQEEEEEGVYIYKVPKQVSPDAEASIASRVIQTASAWRADQARHVGGDKGRDQVHQLQVTGYMPPYPIGPVQGHQPYHLEIKYPCVLCLEYWDLKIQQPVMSERGTSGHFHLANVIFKT